MSEYDRLLREYNIPPGVLSNEELRMLRQGGIRLDDSEGEDEHHHAEDSFNRHTQPRIPQRSFAPAGTDLQAESIKQIYEGKLSMKDKQIDFLQAELSRRDQIL